MSRVRIGVTGSRNYTDEGAVQWALDLVNESYMNEDGLALVYGAATGADELCRQWAAALRWSLDPFPADWGRACDAQCRHGGYRPRRRDGSEWCPAAGPIRNELMARSGLALLLAFPGHKGTEDMIRRAKAAGVRVLRVEG